MKRKSSDFKTFFSPNVTSVQAITVIPGGRIIDFRVQDVAEPTWHTVCRVSQPSLQRGVRWLYYVPNDARHTLLAVLDSGNRPLWLYSDVCLGSEVDDLGFPWTFDAYLDVQALCSEDWQVKATEIVDGDELEEAVRTGKMTPQESELAWVEARRTQAALEGGHFAPLERVRAFIRHHP